MPDLDGGEELRVFPRSEDGAVCFLRQVHSSRNSVGKLNFQPQARQSSNGGDLLHVAKFG